MASRDLVVSNPRSAEALARPLTTSRWRAVGYVQYAKPLATVNRTVNRVRLFLAFGVLGGTLLAFSAGSTSPSGRCGRSPASPAPRARWRARATRTSRCPGRAPTTRSPTWRTRSRRCCASWARPAQETEATLDRQRAFVADASHELRTPLTSILANLELLETELAGEQREMAESALRSSKRMRRLVADLLLLARADAGREAPRAPST